MEGVRPGRMIAYAREVPKRCRVGKVLSNSEDQRERDVTVHVFEARTNHRLQVVWQAAYSTLAGAEFQQQVLGSVPSTRVLGTVELHAGVLNHSSASRLHRAGWRIDEDTVEQGGLVAPVSGLTDEPTVRMSRLTHACDHSAEFRLSDVGALEWAHGVPVFVELFDGAGGLSVAVAAGGWPVAPGVDRCRETYGVRWALDTVGGRARLCFC